MKLIDFIVCDDIREEVSGKQTIVGVYSDLILHLSKNKPSWPLKMKLGFFLRFKIEKEDQLPDSFIFDALNGDNVIATSSGNLNPLPNGTEYVVMPLIHGNFPIQMAGKINFKITFKKDNQNTLEVAPEYSLDVKVDNIS